MSDRLPTLLAGLRQLVAACRALDQAVTRRELRALSHVTDDACPFCGSGNVGVDDGGKATSFVGYCEECHAEGPPGATREQARKNWTQRAV